MVKKKKLTYKEAAEELETIVSEIESDETDVDLLAEKVKRAAFLIKTCKGKLMNAENEVQKVLTEMEISTEADESQENKNKGDNLF